MKRLPFYALILLAAACTQQPAEVEDYGWEYYGRQHEVALDLPNHQTYPVNSPRIKPDYARPVEPARVESKR